MSRAFNFSAGPSALPQAVLERAAAEMLDYGGSGMSVMEMSHRSAPFQEIIDDAEQTLRRLMSIPDDYRVMFLQGGATLQFAGIPMNLMRKRHAGYVVSGNWSRLAWREACKYGQADVVATSEPDGFLRTPEVAGPVSWRGAEMSAFGSGSGMRGIPGDCYSPSRFVRAAYHNAHYPQKDSEAENVSRLFHTLGAVSMVDGAARMGDGAFEVTVYTGGVSTRTNTYYYNTYDDPAIRSVALADFDAAGTEVIQAS